MRLCVRACVRVHLSWWFFAPSHLVGFLAAVALAALLCFTAQIELLNEPVFDMMTAELAATTQQEEGDEAGIDAATMYEREDRDADEAAYEAAEGLDDEAEEAEASREESDNNTDGDDDDDDDDDEATRAALGLGDADDEWDAMAVEGEDEGEEGDGPRGKKGKQTKGLLDDDDDDEEDEDGLTVEDLRTMSTFQRHQREMSKKIQELEEENVADKTWQMSGGVLLRHLPTRAPRLLLSPSHRYNSLTNTQKTHTQLKHTHTTSLLFLFACACCSFLQLCVCVRACVCVCVCVCVFLSARDCCAEADATKRPENSLLDEFLEFDHLAPPPPPMTQEETTRIEDLIKQRIIDNVFDDVERRYDDDDLTSHAAALPDVAQEKSKLSLAEVYEQEFMEASTGAVTSAAERRVQKQRKAVKQLMMAIEDELNALTNAHYLPMRPKEDLTITTNAPTVTLEDGEHTQRVRVCISVSE